MIALNGAQTLVINNLQARRPVSQKTYISQKQANPTRLDSVTLDLYKRDYVRNTLGTNAITSILEESAKLFTTILKCITILSACALCFLPQLRSRIQQLVLVADVSGSGFGAGVAVLLEFIKPPRVDWERLKHKLNGTTAEYVSDPNNDSVEDQEVNEYVSDPNNDSVEDQETIIVGDPDLIIPSENIPADDRSPKGTPSIYGKTTTVAPTNVNTYLGNQGMAGIFLQSALFKRSSFTETKGDNGLSRKITIFDFLGTDHDVEVELNYQGPNNMSSRQKIIGPDGKAKLQARQSVNFDTDKGNARVDFHLETDETQFMSVVQGTTKTGVQASTAFRTAGSRELLVQEINMTSKDGALHTQIHQLNQLGDVVTETYLASKTSTDPEAARLNRARVNKLFESDQFMQGLNPGDRPKSIK